MLITTVMVLIVVDVDWVNDCIKKAALQGPPEWGGYLLVPREAVISERAARDAVSAVFGRPAMQAERPSIRRTANEDAEQIRPGRTIEAPHVQRDPPGSRTEVSRGMSFLFACMRYLRTFV